MVCWAHPQRLYVWRLLWAEPIYYHISVGAKQNSQFPNETRRDASTSATRAVAVVRSLFPPNKILIRDTQKNEWQWPACHGSQRIKWKIQHNNHDTHLHKAHAPMYQCINQHKMNALSAGCEWLCVLLTVHTIRSRRCSHIFDFFRTAFVSSA